MPKRGSLKSAGKRQARTTFLQRSFFNVALQSFACCSAAFGTNDFRTAEKRMSQCNFCSATFQKLQRNFHFRLWHVSEGRNGGSDTSWLNLAFLGRPDFPSGQRSPNTYFKGFWDTWTENRGAPKTPNSTTTDLTPHLRPSECCRGGVQRGGV